MSSAMPSRKPSLALTTPKTATFPADALSFPADALKSAASVRSPQSAFSPYPREPLSAACIPTSAGLPSAGLPSAGLPSAGLPSAGLCSAGLHSPMATIKSEEGLLKTPITPPLAYMDFLKSTSPALPSPNAGGAGGPTSPPTTRKASTSAFHAPSCAAHQPAASRTASSGSTAPTTSAPGNNNNNNNNNNTTTTTTATGNNDTTEGAHAEGKDRSNSISSNASHVSNGSNTSNASNISNSSNVSVASSNSGSMNNDSNNTSASNSDESAASSVTRCSCDCERAHKSPRVARIDTSMPPSPFGRYPMSAPAVGQSTFPSLRIPMSPLQAGSIAHADSPSRSPFSARAVVSPFDWDAALKKRRADANGTQPQQQQHQSQQQQQQQQGQTNQTGQTSQQGQQNQHQHHTCSKPPPSASRLNFRHVREVVTRTVTYTPRMNAPPKGKKRKVECDGSVCS